MAVKELPARYEIYCSKCTKVYWTWVSMRPLKCNYCHQLISQPSLIFNRESGVYELGAGI